MLELSAVGFKVDTSELDSAATKIKGLGTAVEGLSKQLSGLSKESAAANKDQAKANLDNAKAADVLVKTEEKIKKAKGDSAQATNEATESTRKNVSILERQQMILEYMAGGLSKGQSSTMAYAKAAGVLTDELGALKEVLETQRTLQGGDPFDKSLGSLKSLKNELKVLTEVQRMYDSEYALSHKQMENLALDRIRLTEAMKIEKKSALDLSVALKDLDQKYLGAANSVNTMVNADKAIVKANTDAAKANEYLDKELQKVRFGLEANNNELNRGTANSLVRFENNLKKSGLTLDQQKLKLDEYRKGMMELQKTSNAKSTDYITRAVGPQITDIAVGLATGQSPLTVMLQQGGQLRDQFALAGVAAADMGTVMKTAMSSMASSVYATGKAITTMLVGGMVDAGKVVLDFGMKLSGLSALTEKINRHFASLGDEGFKFIGWMKTAGNVMGAMMGGSIVLLITTLIALGVAFNQVRKENDDLAKSLALSGGMLGVSQTQALQYVDTLARVGVTTGTATKVIAEMAKTSSLTSDSINMVAKSAQALYSYADIAIEDTVKAYAKLKDEPVKALLELAKTTGMVSPEIIKLTISLEEQGKKSEAASLAMTTYADIVDKQIGRMKDNYNGFTLAIIEMGNKIKTFFSEAFKSLFLATDPGKAIEQQIVKTSKALADIRKTNAFKGGVDSVVGEADRLEKVLEQLYKQIEAQDRLTAQAATTEQANAKNAKFQEEISKIKEHSLRTEDKALLERVRLEGVKAEAIKDAAKVNKQVSKEDLAYLDSAIAKQNKIIADANKKKPDPAIKELEKYSKTIQERVKDLGIQVLGVTSDLTKAEKLLLDLHDDPLWKKLTPELQKQLEIELKRISAVEKQLEVQKELEKIQKGITAVQENNLVFLMKTSAEDAKTQANLDLRLSLLGLTTEEQKKLNQQAEVANKLAESDLKFAVQAQEVKAKFAKLYEENKTYGGALKIYEAEQAEMNKIYDAAAEARKTINKTVAVQAAEDFAKEMQAISAQLSDIIATALFEGGQVGTKNLEKYLLDTLRKKIVLQIEAFINPIVSAVGGSVASSVSNGGGILNMLSSGKGISDAISGGFSALGASAAQQFSNFATSAVGQNLGLSTVGSAGASSGATIANGGATMTSGATSVASSISQYLPAVMSAVAGYGLYTGISGNKSINPTLDAIGKVASLFGPLYGAIGGLANRAFGMGPKEVRESGIQGSLSTSNGASLNQYARWTKDSGWFNNGDEGTDVTKLDSSISNPFNTAIASITAQTKAFAEVLGLDAKKIEGFTQNIKVQLDNLSTADQQKAIDKIISDFSVGISEVLLGSSKYIKEGETANQTLTRLATSLTTVNAIFDTLNLTLMASNIAGASAASSLIDAFGGLEKFGTSIGNFYENFYTEQEKSAKATENLTKQFNSLGITMPAIGDSTRAWYKSQVEAALMLDQSIPANNAYVASLLGLQDSVNKLAPAFSELTVVVEDNSAAIQKAKDIADERTKLQDELNQLTMTDLELSALKRKSYDESNQALYDHIQSTRAAKDSLAAFSAAFSTAIQGLKNTTFDLESQLLSLQGQDAEVLHRTRVKALEELTKGVAAGDALIITQTYDYNENLKARVKAQQAANDLIDKQTKDAQSLADQQAQDALNAAKDAQNAAQKIIEAWRSIGDSLIEEAAKIRGDILGTGPDAQNNAAINFAKATESARKGDQAAAATLPELSRVLLDFAANNAATLKELNQVRESTASSLETTSAIVQGLGAKNLTVSTPSSFSSAALNTSSSASSGNSVSNKEDVLIALEAIASFANKNYKLLDGVINGANTVKVNVI